MTAFDTPTPTGSLYTSDWERNEDNGGWWRDVTMWEQHLPLPDARVGRTESAEVSVTVSQYADGRIVEPTIWVCADFLKFNAKQARMLAAALLDAADEIERLAQ